MINQTIQNGGDSCKKKCLLELFAVVATLYGLAICDTKVDYADFGLKGTNKREKLVYLLC